MSPSVRGILPNAGGRTSDVSQAWTRPSSLVYSAGVEDDFLRKLCRVIALMDGPARA
jgi:hypothetical protein